MMLHEDRYAFLAILNRVHDVSGVRPDILEKDYYVSMLLRELAEKQNELPAYFKGGTALYKAQKSIRRFSEDIDLTVSIENCSSSQAKRRLEMAAKKYTCLPRTSDKGMEEDRKGSITAVYDYDPVVPVDEVDPLQRFRHVAVSQDESRQLRQRQQVSFLLIRLRTRQKNCLPPGAGCSII